MELRPVRMRASAALAAIPLAAAVLAGCSGQSDPAPASTPTASLSAGMETAQPAGTPLAPAQQAAAAATPPAAVTPLPTATSAPSPTPTFTPVPTPTNGNLCIEKFSDLDKDGTIDQKEPLLAGWSFTVTQGSTTVTTVTTQPPGGVCFPLPVGTYTVSEVLKPGWVPTTPASQTVFIPGGTMVYLSFGNFQLVVDNTNGGPTATN